MKGFFRRKNRSATQRSLTRQAAYRSGAMRAPSGASLKDKLTAFWLLIFGFIYSLRKLGAAKLAGLGVFVMAVITAVIVLGVTRGGAPSETPVNAARDSSPTPSAAPVYTPAYTPMPTPTPQPTPEPEPHPYNMVIGHGVEAAIVETIQERLMKLGYMEDDEPTQYFGNITQHAVELFQRQHGLEIDGKVDAETFDFLMGDEAGKYTVMLGADGTDVRELQLRLREMGYMDDITGHFGEVTETAVKEFQKNNSLSADGKVGAHTREALYSEKSKPNMKKYGQNSAELKKLQERLRALDYLTTTADGNYGSKTKEAVQRFQEISGLITDGFLGYSTVKKLNSSSASSNALKLGMNGTDVTNMQKLLKNLGYTDAVTGYFGEKTQNAVKAFQKSNKLKQDGTVGKATMGLLTSSKAKRAPGSSPGSPGGSAGSGGDSSGSSSGVNKLIATARSKLGCRYVFSAKGPNTFDCSGFVYYCLNHSGVSVGYMTSSAWKTTNRFQRITSMGALKKGDVVVFRGDTYGHVGIYIGGGEMIDASNGRGHVKVTSIKSSYWTSHFVCGYRVY